MIALANDSGGPRSDIVSGAPATGFRASTAQEYATKLHTILSLPPSQQLAIQAMPT
jgi:alpha-1,2-mannosyltransferase